MDLSPFLVSNSVPKYEEVDWVVCRNSSTGPYSLRVEHLRYWVESTMQEESPYTTHWEASCY